MIATTNLTQAPPLFTDCTLSQLHSVRTELKENLRLTNKNGRLYIVKDVMAKNLRRVNRILAARSLKATA